MSVCGPSLCLPHRGLLRGQLQMILMSRQIMSSSAAKGHLYVHPPCRIQGANEVLPGRSGASRPRRGLHVEVPL